MCATSTEIDVDIYSEVGCDKNAEVGLVLGGNLTEVANDAVSSSADHCDASQRVGRIVISPSGDNSEEIAFAIVTRNDGQGLDTCTAADGYKGCIVAKRQLHFEPHTHLDVRVDLRLACIDKPCGTDQTCVQAACVEATCSGASCASEKTLGSNGPKCAPTPATSLTPTVLVANAGDTKTNIPTGLAQHHHLVYAENDQRYWYFWSDNTAGQIKTRVSCDLVNWSDGPPFTISGSPGTNAANFDLAYANANGTDVFHIVLDQTQGNTGYTFDLRYKLANGQPSAPITTQITPQGFGAVSSSECFLTDAPAVAIGTDGTVYIASGWESAGSGTRAGTQCDMDVYQSSGHETGTDADWSPASFKLVGYEDTRRYAIDHVLYRAPSGKIFGAFTEPESTPKQPDYESVAWMTTINDWDGQQHGPYNDQYPNNSIFNDALGTAGANDWSLCMLSDSEPYALRHLDDGTFEAEHWNGSTWEGDGAPPKLAASLDPTMNIVGAGISILQDGNSADGMVAFTIEASGDDNIVWSAHTSAGWSKWAPITGMPNNATRRWVAGTGCGAKGPPVLIWTDLTQANAAVIHSMDVSSLFPAKPPP